MRGLEEGEGNQEEDSRVTGPGTARGRSHQPELPPLQSQHAEKGRHSQDWKQLPPGPRGKNYSRVMMTIHYNSVLSLCFFHIYCI